MKSLAGVVLLVAVAAGPVGSEAADWQRGLLDSAFEAVSAMPLDPHIKNRSREQYKLAETALEQGRPEDAERYGADIAYWQQGAVLADLALHYVEHGDPETGRKYLASAKQWLEEHRAVFSEDSDEQHWRLSRVAARGALVYTALGESAEVAEMSGMLNRDDAPRLLQYKLSQCHAEELNGVVKQLQSLAESGEFEAVKAALTGLDGLYERFYDSAEQRAEIATAIESILPGEPWLAQIDRVVRLGETASAHHDLNHGLALAQRAERMLEQHACAPRFYLPVAARIAALYARAGDRKEALRQLADCMDRFEKNYRKMLNIDRAGALCPVAEAYQAVGEKKRAEAVYLRAVAEAQVNPNSRPRAVDFSLICRALVRQQQKPSPAVFQALEEMKSKLGDPW